MKELKGFRPVELKLMAQAALRLTPLNGSIELLPLCNMNCDMCYVRLSRGEMEQKGGMRTGEQWLALGREMAEAGVLYMQLTGGEPLLHPDFKKIYLGLRRLGLILTVSTNATLIDEQWADFFAKNRPRRINVTLYGPDNETYERLCHYPGGYDRVMEAIRLLRERDIPVRQGFSITPSNVQHIPQFYRVTEELGVSVQTDAYMLPAVRERNQPFEAQNRLLPEEAARAQVQAQRIELGDEEFTAYCRRMIEGIDSFAFGEEKPCESECSSGRCAFTVNWQGMMRPCVIASEPEASVFELGFMQAWKRVSEAVLAVRYSPACSNCKRRSICLVCAQAVKIETGDFMKKPEYLCRYAAEKERLLRQALEESDG